MSEAPRDSYQYVLDTFRKYGLKVKERGAREAYCQAPDHSPADLSVHVKGIDQQTLLYSFSDDTATVMGKLGLTSADLFDNPRGASYEYYDIAEDLARVVHRSPTKKFTQKVIQKGVVPLYRLGEVTAAVKAGKPVYVCEGEKDADTLRTLGVCATTSPQGAQSWQKADYSPLEAATQVFVIGDDDTPGRRRLDGLTQYLNGICQGLVLPLLPPDGVHDAADAIMAGLSLEDFKEYKTTPESFQARPLLTPALDVKLERPVFLLEDVIPLDVITLLSGEAGEGKSTLALYWAARATRGELPGEYYGKPVKVAISAPEDMKGLQNGRLTAAGADLAQIVYLDMATRIEGDVIEQALQFPRDAAPIRETLKEAGVRLWIIDPITGLVEGDTNKRDDVRKALDPLHILARNLHISILGLLHFNKGSGGRSGQKISGSHAFRDVCRAHIPLARDPNTGKRVFSLEKANYSVAMGRSWQFDLTSRDVQMGDGTITSFGRVANLEESEVSVDQVINTQTDNLSDDSTAVIDFINEHREGVTPTEVALFMGWERNKARTYVGRLADSGRITKLRRGVYGPAVVFDLDESKVTPKATQEVTPVATVASVASVATDALKATQATQATLPQSSKATLNISPLPATTTKATQATLVHREGQSKPLGDLDQLPTCSICGEPMKPIAGLDIDHHPTCGEW